MDVESVEVPSSPGSVYKRCHGVFTTQPKSTRNLQEEQSYVCAARARVSINGSNPVTRGEPARRCRTLGGGTLKLSCLDRSTDQEKLAEEARRYG